MEDFGFWVMIIIIFILYACIRNAIEKDKVEKEAMKKRQQENERRQRELQIEQENKRREAMKKEIIDFVQTNKIKNNGTSVYSLYSQMDSLYSRAQREFLVGKMCVPKTPTYTRGVVQGSLADNVSTLANAQKQADYERKMQEAHDSLNKAREHTDSFSSAYHEIARILRSIPNSEKYIEMHEKLYSAKVTQLLRMK